MIVLKKKNLHHVNNHMKSIFFIPSEIFRCANVIEVKITNNKEIITIVQTMMNVKNTNTCISLKKFYRHYKKRNLKEQHEIIHNDK